MPGVSSRVIDELVGYCSFEGELDLLGGDTAFAEDERGFCGAVNYGGGCGVGARAGIDYGVDGVTDGVFHLFDCGGVFFATLVGAGSHDRFGQKLEHCFQYGVGRDSIACRYAFTVVEYQCKGPGQERGNQLVGRGCTVRCRGPEGTVVGKVYGEGFLSGPSFDGVDALDCFFIGHEAADAVNGLGGKSYDTASDEDVGRFSNQRWIDIVFGYVEDIWRSHWYVLGPGQTKSDWELSPYFLVISGYFLLEDDPESLEFS